MRTTTTLWDILFGSDPRAGPPRHPNAAADDTVHELGRALVARAGGRPLAGAASLVAEQLKSRLSLCTAEEIFLRSWNDSGFFRRYLDRDRYPAGRTFEVEMAEHRVTSVHRPNIDIHRDGALLKRICVEIAVTLAVANAIIEIRSGRIRRMRCGQCRGRAELRVQGSLLASGTLAPIVLSGVKDFRGGIPILV